MSEEQKTKKMYVRKWKNFLLMPKIQIQLGIYMLSLALVLFISLGTTIYRKMGEIVEIVVELTDVEDEIRDILVTYLGDISWWILTTLFIYISLNFLLSIIYTHKMIGPTYAFRRHIKQIKEGNLKHRTHLRKGDAFVEIAEDLNELSDFLQNKDN